MGETKRPKYKGLSLDPDESGHMALIPKYINSMLILANDGARLTLSVVQEVGTQYQRGTSHFFVLRSLIRAANFARLGVIGLLLGYYSGAASQMRMAYESILYAFLFNFKPDEALSWLRTTLDTKIDREESFREKQRLRSLAIDLFNQWSGEKEVGKEIWERASGLIHHTVEAIADEAGLEPWQLMSDELIKAMDVAEDNFDSAIKLTSLVSRFSSARGDIQTTKSDQSVLPWTGQFGVLFDEESMNYWSMILLYLVHRMTDFTYRTFMPSDKKITNSYKGWHRAVQTMS